jgi:hypothetical protein
VRVRGELDPAWSAALADLTLVAEPDGSTLLLGELADEAAVHGLLATIRDLGLSLVSVETASTPWTEAADGSAAPASGHSAEKGRPHRHSRST